MVVRQVTEYTDQTYIPPTGDGFSTNGFMDAAADAGLFDIEDAELPGRGTDTGPGITPDYTASTPPKRARVPRVGSLRERFAAAKRGSGNKRQQGAEVPRPRRPAAPRAAKKSTKVPHRRGQFVKPLTQFYTLVGMLTTPKDSVCGPAIVTNAEACARAIDDLAYDNEWLRTLLWQLTQTGMLTKVFIAHAPILFAVGMHHSERFRFAIDNSGMGEFLAGLLTDQATAVRDALAEEESRAEDAA